MQTTYVESILCIPRPFDPEALKDLLLHVISVLVSILIWRTTPRKLHGWHVNAIPPSIFCISSDTSLSKFYAILSVAVFYWNYALKSLLTVTFEVFQW